MYNSLAHGSFMQTCVGGKKEKREEGKRGVGRDDGKEFESIFIYIWATPRKQIRRIKLCVWS